MKKSFKSISAVLAIAIVALQMSAVVQTEGKNSGAYYVVDDDFAMLRANDTDELTDWGWDVLSQSGNINYNYAGNLMLNDNSTSQQTVIRRSFEKQSAERIFTEFRMKLDNTADGSGMSINNGDTETLRLELRGGSLYAGDTGLNTAISVNTEYGVRIEMNLNTKTADVYIDGTKRGTGIALSSDGADNVRVFTSAAGTGRFTVIAMRVMCGYYVADEFIAYKENSGMALPSAWSVKTALGCSVKTVKSAGTPSADYYSLCLTDTKTTNNIGITKEFEEISATDILTFKVYGADGVNNLDIELGTLKARIENNVFKVCDSSGSYQAMGTLPKNLWNTIKLTADFAAGSVTVQLNGKEVRYDFQFGSGAGSASSLVFQTGKTQTDVIWLDDIYLSEQAPTPADYPQEPNKLQKGENDVIVGMQTCDLWHEGKHFGWDKINGYPSRKPYLGYYDDGNPEVKDWEIKYMVEHGIDYSIHCWYRPGNVGTPIKEPRNGYSIHDGLFNAKYKDKMKFAIAWENAGYSPSSTAAAMSDFKENIVPFWIEYYFKDPNYFILDNKVVLNIYNVSRFVERFGEDGAKEAIAYLREQVMACGFDGIYLIGTTSSSRAESLQSYKDYGYDAIYCYSYGQANMPIYLQQKCIAAQKNNSVISYIPTIAMGRDDTPWNRTAGAFVTPDAVEALCAWVKNTYFPNGASGSELGDRMVVIDNWNEYGEGHYFMPSGLAGFGYLEAVGKVFGCPAHTDVRPKNINRLGHLYDQSRDVGLKEGELKWLSKASATPVLRYDFETSTEGFTAGSSIYSEPGSGCEAGKSSFKAQDGCLTAKVSAKDPQFKSPDDLNIPLTADDIVHIRYKRTIESSSTKMYFTTTEGTEMSESKSVTMDVPAKNTGFIDVYFVVGLNANWKGTLKQLRFDPYEEGEGEFFYDVIEILRNGAASYEFDDEFRMEFRGFTSGGSIITAPQDGSINAEFEFNNPYQETVCAVYAAEYDGSGELINVKTENKVISTGKGAFSIEISASKDKRYRVYVWDENMQPLSAANSL